MRSIFLYPSKDNISLNPTGIVSSSDSSTYENPVPLSTVAFLLKYVFSILCLKCPKYLPLIFVNQSTPFDTSSLSSLRLALTLY